MSQHITIQGTVSYPDGKTYETAKRMFNEYRGVKRDGVPLGGLTFDDAKRTVTVTYGVYRNFPFARAVAGAATGRIAWTSTDGCFSGGYWHDGKMETFDLAAWAKDNKLGGWNNRGEYTFDEWSAPDDEDEDPFSDYCDWQSDVEDEFFAKYTPDAA